MLYAIPLSRTRVGSRDLYILQKLIVHRLYIIVRGEKKRIEKIS